MALCVNSILMWTMSPLCNMKKGLNIFKTETESILMLCPECDAYASAYSPGLYNESSSSQHRCCRQQRPGLKRSSQPLTGQMLTGYDMLLPTQNTYNLKLNKKRQSTAYLPIGSQLDQETNCVSHTCVKHVSYSALPVQWEACHPLLGKPTLTPQGAHRSRARSCRQVLLNLPFTVHTLVKLFYPFCMGLMRS